MTSAHIEALRRCALMARSRTPLGHYWHQKQLVEALKAMLSDPQMTIDRCALCGTPITTAALCDKCGRKS